MRAPEFVRILCLAFACFLLNVETLAAPAAPSGLYASVTSATSATLNWFDNSTDETHFEFSYTDNGAGPYLLPLVSGNSGQKGWLNIPLSPLVLGHTYTFKVRSFISTNANASAYSNTITVTTNDFATPNIVAAAVQDEGSILLTWVDNAITEAGYLIESRILPSGVFSVLGTSNKDVPGLLVGTLIPGATYEFRVRGFKGTANLPTATTAYSGVISATVPATLPAPANLTANLLPPAEVSIGLAYEDKSANNTGYEVAYRISTDASFTTLDPIPDWAAVDFTNSFEPGTGYEFKVRAFYQDGANPAIYSNYSNTASYTTPFHAPTAPSATTFSASQINLTWTDNSQAEGGYAIYIRDAGVGSFSLYGYSPANATSYSVQNLSPGVAYEFQIAAAFQQGAPRSSITESARTATVAATTLDGFTCPPYVTFAPDNSYFYRVTTSNTVPRTSWSVTDLPAGMNFNANTGDITGTPGSFGVFNATLSATFGGTRTVTQPLVIRFQSLVSAPVIATPINAQVLTAGSSVEVVMADKFTDPDTESAVRVTTNQGTMDFILFNTATPQTVANFMSYVNAPEHNFANSVFHRSVPGFVIQGGAFKVQSAPDVFSVTPTSPSPTNEPGLANLRGSIAMAKQGGNPNSATNQFFVSLADNRSVLDHQNGGFTVFGRIAGNGMAVADAIAALPNSTYDVKLGGQSQNFENWPLTSASAQMDTSKAVVIQTITPITTPLSHSIGSNTHPTVVSATILGGQLHLQALAGGTSEITVTATDLDGNSNHQSFTVTVNETFATWATAQGLSGGNALPTSDPDHDGMTNAEEFAFLTNPQFPTENPAPLEFTLSSEGGISLTFPQRRFAPGLIYTVEVSESLLPGSWSTVWTSTSGFQLPTSNFQELPDRNRVLIYDQIPSPETKHRYYRLRVSIP